MMPLPDRQKCDGMSILFDTVPALGRQTDGRSDRNGKTISLSACIGMLTHDKNRN